MTYPNIPGTPSTLAKVLDTLANHNKLSGITPAWLESIAEGESGFEVKGAGVNSSGYGGYFGLQATGKYVSGSASRATLETHSVAALTHQAEIVAGDLASAYTGTPGKTTAARGFEGDTKYVNANLAAVKQGLNPHFSGTAGGVGATPITTPVGAAKTAITGTGPAVTGSTVKNAVGGAIKFATDPLGYLVSKESGLLIRGALIVTGIILVLIGAAKLFSGNTDTNPVTTLVEGGGEVGSKAKESAKTVTESAGMAAAA